MSIVDLSSRLTQDWNAFNRYLKSSDSLIYIEGPIIITDTGTASLDLSVGDRWLNHQDESLYLISQEGLQLRSRESVIIETEQRLALPLNALGLVTGKGKYIFQGVFMSSGKIDPGFNGKLKIGLYNASRDTVILNTGELFCSCCMFQMESSLDVPCVLMRLEQS